MMRIADLSFGVDPYALPLLAILSTAEPDFADFLEEAKLYDVSLRTDVYRSGTRNWVSITMFGALDGRGPRKVVAFGRDPFVDAIGLEIWDLTEAADLDEVPSQTVSFSPRDLMKVAQHIKGLLANAYQTLRAPQA
jgi:hypothetical protein